MASKKGHIDIVKFLVSKVENPNEPRNDGVTPIQIASQQGNIDIVEILSTYIKQWPISLGFSDGGNDLAIYSILYT